MTVTPNVTAALAAVMAEIGGVAKMTADQRRKAGMGGGDAGGQITYAYRGIDQIAAAAQPLLGKHGVVIVPFDTTYSVDELTINSKPWTETTCIMTWHIIGPGGVTTTLAPDGTVSVEGDFLVAKSIGLGRDNSDKGANKASTTAFKNLLLRLLCIGDPNDDTDGHTHEADAAPPPAPVDPAAAALVERLTAASADTKATLRALGKDHKRGFSTDDLADPAWRAVVAGVLDAPSDSSPATTTDDDLDPCSCRDVLLEPGAILLDDTGIVHRRPEVGPCHLDDNEVHDTPAGEEATP